MSDKDIIKFERYNIIANPHLSDDMDLLREHYTILLEYVAMLEKRNDKLKERLNFVGRRCDALFEYYEKTKNKISIDKM